MFYCCYKNVKMNIKDDKLIIEIDLTYRGEISKTGKSKRIASTEGNKKIEGYDECMIGLNVYAKI